MKNLRMIMISIRPSLILIFGVIRASVLISCYREEIDR